MVGVEKHTAYRALWLAIEMVNGKHADQYKYAGDYANAVMKWIQGSCVRISFDRGLFSAHVCAVGSMQRGFFGWL